MKSLGSTITAYSIVFFMQLMFVACNSGVNSMVEDYNDNFNASKTSITKIVSITDEDFSESNMLSLRYTLAAYDTLCLLAPNDGKKYQWTAVMTDGRNFDSTKPQTLDLGSTQQLTVYVPNSKLAQWSKYDLTLTVYDAAGTKYTDTAVLVVY